MKGALADSQLEDNAVKDNEHTIPAGKTQKYKLEWTPTLIGKHLLTIDIYDEEELVKHIERGVSVTGSFEDNLAKVQTMRRTTY